MIGPSNHQPGRPQGHKRLQQHRLLQAQLPAPYRAQGWQLFQIQGYYLAWHLPSLAYTAGYPTLTDLFSEIHDWNAFLGYTPVSPTQQHATTQRFAAYSTARQLMRHHRPGVTYDTRQTLSESPH